jgi:hypothetical protein
MKPREQPVPVDADLGLFILFVTPTERLHQPHAVAVEVLAKVPSWNGPALLELRWAAREAPTPLWANLPPRHVGDASRRDASPLSGEKWNSQDHLVVKLRKLTDVSVCRKVTLLFGRILALHLNRTNDDTPLDLLGSDEIKANVALGKINAPALIAKYASDV